MRDLPIFLHGFRPKILQKLVTESIFSVDMLLIQKTSLIEWRIHIKLTKIKDICVYENEIVCSR